MKQSLHFFISAGVLLYSTVFSANASTYSILPEQCALMKERNVITDKNPVGCDRLVNVTFKYIDFNGRISSNGNIVVLDIVAEHVKELFAELLMSGIPVSMAKPMEHFNGVDEDAMLSNNTSAFNGRAMTGGSDWSKHAYGVAIDINPLQNPYISQRKVSGVIETIVLPPQSKGMFLDRSPIRSGMAEEMLSIFYKHGFLVWGGNWKDPVDYQHFEIGSRKFIKSLVAMSPEAGKAAFKEYIGNYRQCISASFNKGRELRRSIRDTCAKQQRK
jgi:hypothetical protein